MTQHNGASSFPRVVADKKIRCGGLPLRTIRRRGRRWGGGACRRGRGRGARGSAAGRAVDDALQGRPRGAARARGRPVAGRQQNGGEAAQRAPRTTPRSPMGIRPSRPPSRPPPPRGGAGRGCGRHRRRRSRGTVEGSYRLPRPKPRGRPRGVSSRARWPGGQRELERAGHARGPGRLETAAEVVGAAAGDTSAADAVAREHGCGACRRPPGTGRASAAPRPRRRGRRERDSAARRRGRSRGRRRRRCPEWSSSRAPRRSGNGEVRVAGPRRRPRSVAARKGVPCKQHGGKAHCEKGLFEDCTFSEKT